MVSGINGALLALEAVEEAFDGVGEGGERDFCCCCGGIFSFGRTEGTAVASVFAVGNVSFPDGTSV